MESSEEESSEEEGIKIGDRLFKTNEQQEIDPLPLLTALKQTTLKLGEEP